MVATVSVVISRFGTREASWDRVRDCLRSIAAQDGTVEAVLCRIPGLPGETPADLADIHANLKILNTSIEDGHARATAGIRASAGSIVALLDADCMLQNGWLATVRETFEFYPEVAVVHGKMAGETGGITGTLRRLFAGPDPKTAGPAKFTATNNVAFRREAYLDYPLPEGSGTDAVRIQTAAMLRAHYVLWQMPEMLALRDRRGLAKAAGVAVERPAAIAR